MRSYWQRKRPQVEGYWVQASTDRRAARYTGQQPQGFLIVGIALPIWCLYMLVRHLTQPPVWRRVAKLARAKLARRLGYRGAATAELPHASPSLSPSSSPSVSPFSEL